MKNFIKTVVICIITSLSAFSQTNQVFFASYPTLSPDAKTVIYSYEGDLWRGELDTKQTSRITAMQGVETRPRISPDGKWLAFSGSQYGNSDVFVMPTNGGEIRQLTFHDSNDIFEAWAWDSQTIYFKNSSQNNGTTFTVNVNGGTPKRLFGHFFNRLHNIAIHQNGEIFFNDTWESDNQAYRKRYKGEFNPEIQSYNPFTKTYKRYTDYIGKDMWTSIDEKGNIFFASDEGTDEYNLFTFRNNKKTALTNFKESIKHPMVSANGQKVVFEKDFQLWIYDVLEKKSSKISFNTSRNFTLPKAQDFNVKGNITNFDVSPDAKKIAFASRGELFVSDIEGKYIKQLKTRTDGRVQEIKWLDNQMIMFGQTVNGYPNWFSILGDGKGEEKQLTNDLQSNRQLSLNKDKSKGIYLSGRNELKMIDLKTFESKVLVKDEFWAIQSDAPVFSPNDEYVMFMAYRNFERDILLYKIADGQIFNLTNSGITEADAQWSPDGKYIYFSSDRLNPFYPFGNQDTHIYRFPLSKIDAPYKSDKFAELWKIDAPKIEDSKKEDAKTAKKDTLNIASKKPETDKKEVKKEPITLDLNGLMERMELVSPAFGTQDSPFVIQKDSKTTVIYASDHDEGKSAIWKTVFEPFVAPKTERIEEARGFDVVAIDGKYFILVAGTIKKLNIDANKLETIDINHTFRRNLADEFNQMFYETWAGVGENFYNETFHGANWQQLQTYYAQFLPHINSRSDFREMMQDMLGELNSSHTGFTSNGAEEATFYKNSTMNIGILFEDENPYRVKSIVRRTPADKSDKNIQAGDVLIKVNNEAIDPTQNRDFYFTKPSADTEIELTFSRNNTPYSVKVHPQATGTFTSNLYEEWIDRNQKQVDELSKKRIAYVHLRNMGLAEYDKFVIDMTQDFYQKDALIVDLRYNTGGNIHDKVLNFLAQKPYLQWKYREGKLTPQPNFGPASKPIILLINEQSLSDAEMTAQGFKTLKLGKIIGTETYRWIIFTSGKGLVDGSFYRLPSWGCYTLDGKNLEKEGVKPDIYIKQTFADRLQDKDPQIEKAVEEILKELK